MTQQGLPTGQSVSSIITQIRAVLRDKLTGEKVLFGVVAGLKVHGYMDLVCTVDPSQAISASFYGNQTFLESYRVAGVPLKDGMQVLLQGRFTLSKRGSTIRFMVTGAFPEYTKALVKAKRDLTNERLRKEGLFDLNRACTLSMVPQGLGILTSEKGTVIHDLIAALAPAKFRFGCRWIPVPVTGSDATRRIPEAIALLAEDPKIDVVLLFRGGGSATDLDCFNEYEIARAIAACPKPVLCAIGHREDECSAQDVAYRNCHTPSLLGEFLTEIIVGRRELLSEVCAGISTTVRSTMEDKRTRLQQIAATARQAIRGKVLSTKTALRNLASRIPVALRARVAAVATAITSHWASAIALSRRECRNSATQVQSLCRRVPGSARGAVEKRRLRVQALHEKLAGADPAVILRRGFALIEDREGKVITSAKALSHPSELTIQFSDSKILATSHA